MSEAAQLGQSRRAAIDGPGRRGSIRMLLLVGLLLLGAGWVLLAGQFEQRELLQLVFLASLAVFGIFCLFAWAVGFLKFGGQRTGEHPTRAVVDSMQEGALVTDLEGRIIYANNAYVDHARLGVNNTSNDVRTVERIFAGEPEAADSIYRLCVAAKDGKRAQEEFRLTNRERVNDSDSDVSWYRVRVRPVRLDDSLKQDLDYLVWNIADISRDRERQENIFQELQLAIDYLDHAPAGFFSADESGQIIYCNATLAIWLGYDLAQMDPNKLHVDQLISGDGAALLSSSTATGNQSQIFDIDFVHKNGSTFPGRVIHRVPVSADGSVGASRTLVLNRGPGSDISEALRTAEIRFSRFFNNTPIAIAAMDKKGVIGRTNAPFMMLFSDLLKQQNGASNVLSDLIIQKDRPALEVIQAAALSGQINLSPVNATTLHAEQSGSPDERTVRFFISAVVDSEDEDDDGDAAIVYVLETTEQRALEEQFAQSQKMQAVGQLAGGVAHDFNNVLTAIIGFSDLLLANHRPTDPAFQDIMNIKQNANRAASLVRQLLAFSRRQTLRLQVLSLGDVLADLSILLDRLLGEKVELDVVHGRDLWPVKADLNQLEQVVVNLAVNARDAMSEKGKLTIRTINAAAESIAAYGYKAIPEAEFVLIEVEDSGSGIPENIRDKIFEPFFSTKDVGKGTGLGLSTVYGIIKQTGGFIFVDSEEGKGTVFRIFLPRHIVDQAEEQETQKNAEEEAAAIVTNVDLTGSATILLVEDEEAVRAFAVRALESRGYVVHEASDGAEALELMEDFVGEIDLVVSDVVMPEMDGPTLLGELRKIRPELKVIFMSGYAEEAFRKNLPRNEKFGFLPKPFSLKQLATTIKETLEG